MNSIPYTKEDRRANAPHLQRQFVQRMFNAGEMINDCHEAIRVASDDIWQSMQTYGGWPAGASNADSATAECRYWTRREQLMRMTYAEAGYQIWRSIQLADGDPTFVRRPVWPLDHE